MAAGAVLRLIDGLEDLDYLNNVVGKFDVSDRVLESLDA
jgi:hypothetical protein